MSKIERLAKATDTFAQALRAVLPSASADVQDARKASQKFDSKDYGRITDKDEYVDLYDFAQHIYGLITRPAVRSAAQTVMDTIEETVIVEHHVSSIYDHNYLDLNGSHGISIYFPPKVGSDYNPYVSGSLFTFSAVNRWTDFLQDYFTVVTLPPDTSDPGLAPMLPPSATVYLPIVRR